MDDLFFLKLRKNRPDFTENSSKSFHHCPVRPQAELVWVWHAKRIQGVPPGFQYSYI